MATHLIPMAYPTEPSDSADTNEPDTLATPEGDAEQLPTAPLPSPEPPIERPRGNEPHYKQPERDALD